MPNGGKNNKRGRKSRSASRSSPQKSARPGASNSNVSNVSIDLGSGEENSTELNEFMGHSSTPNQESSSSGIPSPAPSLTPTGRKRGSKSRNSEVWEHFQVKIVDGIEKNCCNYCDVSYLPVGGTGNMKNHLTARHSEKLMQSKSRQMKLDQHFNLQKPFKVIYYAYFTLIILCFTSLIIH